MAEIFPRLRTKSSKGKSLFYGSIAFLLLALFVIIFIILKFYNRAQEEKEPEFDVQSCVRMLDISKVYKIVPSDKDTNILWFAAAEGIRVLNRETLEWTRLGLDHGLPSEIVADIAFANGVPWVATWHGIAWYDSITGTFQQPLKSGYASDSRILSVEHLAGKGIFLTPDRAGLYFLDTLGDSLTRCNLPDAPPTGRITCVKAMQGRLWVGVENRLVYRSDSQGVHFKQIPFETPYSNKTLIWDIILRKGSVWVATSDDGIYRAEKVGDTLVKDSTFPAKGAYVFAQETDGFWCGTPYGLWRYHEDQNVWMHFVNPKEENPTDFQVMALCNTAEALWYGSMDLGAGYLTKNNIHWISLRAGLSRPNVAALAVIDTMLYTAYGYQGEWMDGFSARTLQYDRNVGLHDGISDPTIQCFTVALNRLWFGGFQGFGYLDYATRRSRYWLPDHGAALSHGDIAQIVFEGDSTVWLASQFGIVRFLPRIEGFQPIPSTEPYRVTSLTRAGNTLYFGTLAHGIRALNVDTWATTPVIACKDRVMGIALLPNSTTLAFAVRSDGLQLYNYETQQHQKIPLSSNLGLGNTTDVLNNIMAMRLIDNRIWCGLRDNGCVVYDLKLKSWYFLCMIDGLASNQVRSFYDTPDQVWVGCYGGICRFDKKYLEEKVFSVTKK